MQPKTGRPSLADGFLTPGARATALRNQIEKLQAQLAYLERVKQSWESYALGTLGENDGLAASKLGEVRRSTQQFESSLASAQAQWRQLEDQARQQQVPPGWLR